MVLYADNVPDTREFITRTVGLWNRWIRLSCYYNRVYNTCPLYTRVTPILQCIGPCYSFRSFRSIFVYNIYTWTYKQLPDNRCHFIPTRHALSGQFKTFQSQSKLSNSTVSMRGAVNIIIPTAYLWWVNMWSGRYV